MLKYEDFYVYCIGWLWSTDTAGRAALVCGHIFKRSVFIGIDFLPMAENSVWTCKRFHPRMIYRHHVLETEMKSILCAKKKRLQSLVGHTGFYFFSNIKKNSHWLKSILFCFFYFLNLLLLQYWWKLPIRSTASHCCHVVVNCRRCFIIYLFFKKNF